jgi:GntR family transcriptional repressor for pyruvate dehydrogenase complex
MSGKQIFHPVERVSLTEAVVNQLKNLILDGRLKPGEKLSSERELCSELGVSRTAIREAKRALITMGLLEARPGEGTFVRSPLFADSVEASHWEALLGEGTVSQLIEARRILEMASAGLAAQRLTPSEGEAILQTVRDIQAAVESGNDEAFLASDLAFHTTIARATHNAVLVQMTQVIRAPLRNFIKAVVNSVEGYATATLTRHQEITDAILAGDAIGAREAMDRHLTEVESMLLEPVERSAPDLDGQRAVYSRAERSS